jgi:hypothetical protein
MGGLAQVIINVEPHQQKDAVSELVARTGLHFQGAYADRDHITAVLTTHIPAAADFLIRSRKTQNPFSMYNMHPKSSHLPNTRL